MDIILKPGDDITYSIVLRKYAKPSENSKRWYDCIDDFVVKNGRFYPRRDWKIILEAKDNCTLQYTDHIPWPIPKGKYELEKIKIDIVLTYLGK